MLGVHHFALSLSTGTGIKGYFQMIISGVVSLIVLSAQNKRCRNMLRFPWGISQQVTRAKTTLAVFPIPWAGFS